MALRFEQRRERVAQRRLAAVADVQRPGRIGRDELDLHFFRIRRLRAAEVRAFLEDALDDLQLLPGADADIDESGARDFQRCARSVRVSACRRTMSSAMSRGLRPSGFASCSATLVA